MGKDCKEHGECKCCSEECKEDEDMMAQAKASMAKGQGHHSQEKEMHARQGQSNSHSQRAQSASSTPVSEHELYVRLQAEFANYKKRVEKEKDELRILANTRLLKQVAELFSDAQKALEAAQKKEGCACECSGIALLSKKIDQVLKSEGVSIIAPAKGELFDHSVHEAAACVNAEGAVEGTIVEVVKNGFSVHGRVVEPALVVLCKKS